MNFPDKRKSISIILYRVARSFMQCASSLQTKCTERYIYFVFLHSDFKSKADSNYNHHHHRNDRTKLNQTNLNITNDNFRQEEGKKVEANNWQQTLVHLTISASHPYLRDISFVAVLFPFINAIFFVCRRCCYCRRRRRRRRSFLWLYCHLPFVCTRCWFLCLGLSCEAFSLVWSESIHSPPYFHFAHATASSTLKTQRTILFHDIECFRIPFFPLSPQTLT